MLRRKKTFKPILAYHNRATANLLIQLKEHDRLLNIARSALPKDLAKHLLYCVIKEEKLLLFSASAIWGSQLRFNSKLILETVCAKTEAAIAEVKVRILVHHSPTEQQARGPVIPSSEIIESIRIDLLNAPDSDLKDALIRLSETLKAC